MQTLINTFQTAIPAKGKLAIADSYYKEAERRHDAGHQRLQRFIVFFPSCRKRLSTMQVAMAHYRQMEKRTAPDAGKERKTSFRRFAKNPKIPGAPAEHGCGKYRSYWRKAITGSLLLLRERRTDGQPRQGCLRWRRYPLYSKSDKALWMLEIFREKRA